MNILPGIEPSPLYQPYAANGKATTAAFLAKERARHIAERKKHPRNSPVWHFHNASAGQATTLIRKYAHDLSAFIEVLRYVA
jgi:hypothetical protein